MGWIIEDKVWINRMKKFFDDLFGFDFCQFDDIEIKYCIFVFGQYFVRMYDYDEWEKNVGKVMVKDDGEDDSIIKESVNVEIVKKVNVGEEV